MEMGRHGAPCRRKRGVFHSIFIFARVCFVSSVLVLVSVRPFCVFSSKFAKLLHHHLPKTCSPINSFIIPSRSPHYTEPPLKLLTGHTCGHLVLGQPLDVLRRVRAHGQQTHHRRPAVALSQHGVQVQDQTFGILLTQGLSDVVTCLVDISTYFMNGCYAGHTTRLLASLTILPTWAVVRSGHQLRTSRSFRKVSSFSAYPSGNGACSGAGWSNQDRQARSF